MRSTGILLFLAGAIVLMGITSAEIFYPEYSIPLNMISTLGSTPPPTDLIHEPSATIFDLSMIVAGLLLMAGAYIYSRTEESKLLSLTLVFMGLGAFGVGIFPAFHPLAHPLAAATTFSFGALSAIFSIRVIRGPFWYLALLLGATSLIFLLVGTLTPELITPTLGIGGTERWVAYPILIWLLGFGGYLMADRD